MWDLVPWPGIEPGPPALGAWSLNHCTTREVPIFILNESLIINLYQEGCLSCCSFGKHSVVNGSVILYTTWSSYWYFESSLWETRRTKNKIEMIEKWYIPRKRRVVPAFPGGTVVKNLPVNVGDTGLSPGPGRSHMPQSNWARAPQLLSLLSRTCEPQLLSPCTTTTEAPAPRARAPQQEKPPQ